MSILPCPFCGGEAKIQCHSLVMHGVGCDVCHLMLYSQTLSEAGAIAAWNRRTPPAPAPNESQIDALKAAIEGECHGLAISDEQARAILSYVSALRQPAPAPEGWVTVPKEPTPEMVRAGSGAQSTVSDCGSGLVFAATETDIYRVMISAAPAAPNEWQVVGFRYRFEPHLQWHLVEFENDIPDRAAWPNMDVQKVYAAAPTEGRDDQN